MRLATTVKVPHSLDPQQNTVLQLGLQPLDPRQWMQVDNDYDQFYRHKVSMQKQFGDKAYFALARSEPAQEEFHQCLSQHLLSDHSQYQLKNDAIRRGDNYSWASDFESLWQSCLMVQEDICLLESSKDGYVMTAASVCSPSNWRLEEKQGRNLDFIHQPVPDYQSVLGERVNRLFNRLKTNAPLLRFNWSLQADNELFWRSDLDVKEEAGEPQWYWRIERQTLRRLPKTQAIVFSIRIYLYSIQILSEGEGFESLLNTIIDRLPVNQQHYKGLQLWQQQRQDVINR